MSEPNVSDDQREAPPTDSRMLALWVGVLVLAGAWMVYRVSTTGMGYAYVQERGGLEMAASYGDYVSGVARFSLSRTIGIWTAGLLTLAIFSFLYRDNPCYKLAEAIFVGVSAAYYMVMGFWTVIVPNLLGNVIPDVIHHWAMPGLSPVRKGDWYLYLVPLVLGVMLLWRLSPKGTWIARWPLAFIIGTTAGLRLIGFLQADFLSQIHASIVPVLVFSSEGFDVWASVRSLLLILSVLATLVYFFFSIEHKGVVGHVARGGVWVLMITFGASFGYTVMGRIALLVSRFQFLFSDWLWLIDPLGQRIGM